MYPQIKGIPFVYSFSFCLFIAFLVSSHLFKKEIKKKIDISDSVANQFLCLTFFAGIIGARTLHFATNSENIGQFFYLFFTERGGATVLGGIFSGITVAFIYCSLYHIHFVSIVNMMAAIAPLGMAIGRIGCLLNGCCYGYPYHNNVPWYAVTSHHQLYQTFPIQLVSALLLGFIIFPITWNMRKSKIGSLSTFLVLYSLYRIPVEYLRYDPSRAHVFGITESQFYSLCMLGIGILLIFKNLQTTKNAMFRSET